MMHCCVQMHTDVHDAKAPPLKFKQKIYKIIILQISPDPQQVSTSGARS